MKLAYPLAVLTAFSGAYSLALPRNGKATIIDVLSGVQTAINSLDGAIQGWKTDPTTTLTACNKLTETINHGTKIVKTSENLQMMDAVQLLKPVSTLTTSTKTLVEHLKAKKTQIQGQGLCDAVRSEVNDIQASSKELVAAVVSKLPQNVQSIAMGATKPITDSIEDAKQAYSEANCVDFA